jgi:hypothetical protein
MLEIILPCPNCHTSLLVDEQNAGTDVLCPGCEVRLTLPRDLSGASQPELARTDLPHIRKNVPLHRSGHLAPLPEDAVSAGTLDHKATHLPEHRGLSREEEMRRLATLTADPGTFDLHNVDTRGRTAFPCPACHRPVWIGHTEWGQEMICEGCSQQIKAPDPANHEPARVLQPVDTGDRPKTVLPTRRQVEDLAMGEQTAAGRPKRQGGALPSARNEARAVPEDAADRLRSAGPDREPIPARGDVELSAPVRKGPPSRRTVTSTQEQNAAAAEFEASVPAASPAELPTGKFVQRLTTERLPTFTPKHEADLSAEATGNWGGTAPQEQSPAFRRTLTLAVLTLLLGAVGITAYLLSDYFKEKPAHSNATRNSESPVQNVKLAQTALEKFFKARSIEEMAKEVRHPEKTLPRMKVWYTRNSLPKHEVEFTEDWREQDNWEGSGVNFIFTTIKLDGLPERDVALETFADGRAALLDWEDFVSWSETPWSEFLKTTSLQPAEFRVAVTLTDYYNGIYSDRQRYLSFRVSDRDNFGSCYAYCEVNSELGKALLGAVQAARQAGRIHEPSGDGIAQVILRLRFLPEGQKFNQASIDAVVRNSWLEP